MTRLLETLSRVPLFGSLSPEDIRRLDSQCAWRRAAAKDWIIEYQDEGTDVFFVVSGSVRVLIRAVSGREVILNDIGAGEFFGELAAIDGRPRSASVLAITDATIARMPASVFLEAVSTHPEVCLQVLRILTAKVRNLTNRIDEYSTLHVRHRIYSELLRLSRPDHSDNRRMVISPPPIHADIAARVSARRESVTRELKALERDGLLQRRRGALVLTDPHRLMELIDAAQLAD